jgi:hypothetical protein
VSSRITYQEDSIFDKIRAVKYIGLQLGLLSKEISVAGSVLYMPPQRKEQSAM